MGNVTACKAHSDCFANRDGICVCLKNNDFGNRDCPFYKPADVEKKGNYSRKQEGDGAYGNQQV